MPYKDPEAQKEYFRQYNFNRREASKIWRDGRKEERSKKAKDCLLYTSPSPRDS